MIAGARRRVLIVGGGFGGEAVEFDVVAREGRMSDGGTLARTA